MTNISLHCQISKSPTPGVFSKQWKTRVSNSVYLFFFFFFLFKQLSWGVTIWALVFTWLPFEMLCVSTQGAQRSGWFIATGTETLMAKRFPERNGILSSQFNMCLFPWALQRKELRTWDLLHFSSSLIFFFIFT